MRKPRPAAITGRGSRPACRRGPYRNLALKAQPQARNCLTRRASSEQRDVVWFHGLRGSHDALGRRRSRCARLAARFVCVSSLVLARSCSGHLDRAKSAAVQSCATSCAATLAAADLTKPLEDKARKALSAHEPSAAEMSKEEPSRPLSARAAIPDTKVRSAAEAMPEEKYGLSPRRREIQERKTRVRSGRSRAPSPNR